MAANSFSRIVPEGDYFRFRGRKEAFPSILQLTEWSILVQPAPPPSPSLPPSACALLPKLTRRPPVPLEIDPRPQRPIHDVPLAGAHRVPPERQPGNSGPLYVLEGIP